MKNSLEPIDDCLFNDSTIVCFVDQIYVFTLTYYNNNTIVVYAYHKLRKALNIEESSY